MTAPDLSPENLTGIPGDLLFVLVGEPIYCLDGIDQVTYWAFTRAGICGRTIRRRDGGRWEWLRHWDTGEPIAWSEPRPYEDGETPEYLRAWHEREHGWRECARGVQRLDTAA